MSQDSLIEILRRVWALLDRSQRRRFLGLQGLSILMAVSTLLGLTAVAPFLAVCTDPSLIERNAALARLYAVLGSASQAQFVSLLGLAFVLLVCVGNAVNLYGTAAIRRFAHQAAARWQAALFDEYLHRDAVFHARSDSAALASRVVRHVDGCALGILQGLLVLSTSVFTGLLIFVTALLLDPAVALLAATAFAGGYMAVYRAIRRRLLSNGGVQARRWSERARIMAGGFGAIKEILVAGNQRFFRESFARQSDAIARSAADTLAVAQFPRNAIECVAAAVLVGAALSLRAAGQSHWLAELTFFALAAYRLIPALQQGFSAAAHITAERAVFESIAADLSAALGRPVAPGNRAAKLLEWRPRPQRDIRLEQVSFRYAPHLPLAICDLSLRIPAGSRVALVGANGSGKTTVADLITGLLLPHSGVILVDDEILDVGSRHAWQANIAYVPQAIFLQNASVAQNIAFGVASAEIDPARVRAAARQAQLEELIEALPNGYDEPLGERGARVSGGQRQLIGIARALYRRASLLVLDESTNALDVSNERRVIAALRADTIPRTTIIIAHHCATLRECDLVLKLDAGRLAAGAVAAAPRLEAH